MGWKKDDSLGSADVTEKIAKIIERRDAVSIIEGSKLTGDSQGTAFTTTYPDATGHDPSWSDICFQTHVNVPGYNRAIATVKYWATLGGLPPPSAHSTHGKDCSEQGFKNGGLRIYVRFSCPARDVLG